MKKKTWILYLAVGLALVAFVLYARHRINFNWAVFIEQLRLANYSMIGLGVALISFGYIVRAVRWSLFLKPIHKVRFFSRDWFHVLAAQVIGYAGVALLGRAADLVRPYLVARRLKLDLSSQLAVYVVERMFDFGAMACIFSAVLFLAPGRASLPHHREFKVAAEIVLGFTAGLAIAATAIRFSGKTVAALAQKILGKLSQSLGATVSDKILAFREGLEMLASPRDIASAALFSLFMWGLITYAYLVSIRAFVDSPHLHNSSLGLCVVLMAVGMAVSVVQLPVVGWFTQIAGLTYAIQQIYGAAWEPALGCSAVLLIVTFLCVIPTGLIWAHFDHVSLRKVSEESEEAGTHIGVESLTPPEPAAEP
ncbi:MAG TPA: lysylphosphatidylglycerol synthase transmembrane domain-containing protein [Acidobacteriaceae bacterium]|nr:lysylphosphatidylglycerol synthase transmembrane domain-containing protein [Acidobacteriaceae bacterium]